jgi:NAD(P)-dependent dehydrogenase (short-subunit alcohol dehydrogenase family)
MNTESAVWGAYSELPLDRFAQSFDVNVVSLLQLVQTLFPKQDDIPADTRLVVSSSPAAYEPAPVFMGLAPSRVAQRVLAELLNESLAESGLQFSVLSIDGAIDEPAMRLMFANQPTTFFIQPADIASLVKQLFEADTLALQTSIGAPSSFSSR